MHSRIFQISDSPISESDYMTEDIILEEEWFMNTVADYVTAANREDSIDWFVDCHDGLECFIYENDRNVFRLTHDFKTKFLRPDFDELRKIVNHLQNTLNNEATAFKDFVSGVGDIGFDIWKLHNITSPYGGFYVFYQWTEGDEPYEELMTLDSFMRHHAECGKRYYFGSALDYHY